MPDTALPKLKQLTLTDDQMDYVAACVSQTSTMIVGNIAQSLLSSIMAERIMHKIGPDGLNALLDQLKLLVETE